MLRVRLVNDGHSYRMFWTDMMTRALWMTALAVLFLFCLAGHTVSPPLLLLWPAGPGVGMVVVGGDGGEEE